MACDHGHGLGAHLFSWKTASYALMHLAVAIMVAYALTLDWHKALAIGIIEPIVQTFAFSLHDRYWSRRSASEQSAEGRVPVVTPVATAPLSP